MTLFKTIRNCWSLSRVLNSKTPEFCRFSTAQLNSENKCDGPSTTELIELPPEEHFHTKQEENADIHPYKILFPWKSKNELAEHLCKNIIHFEDGLVVFNKPFGIGVRNLNVQNRKSENPINNLLIRGIGSSPYTLEDVLPHLRKQLNIPSLSLVKSTEKYSSGIAVFAINEKSFLSYGQALKRTKPSLLYTFSVLSTLIPSLDDGKIEERVAIKQQSHPLTDLKQPMIVRTFTKDAVERQDLFPVRVTMSLTATNEFKIALLKLKTTSTKWNFIRIYCADMLAPIFGDHLFSARVQTINGVPTKIHPVHLVPGSSMQKIPEEVLLRLQLQKKDDALTVPTHIHLSSLELKGFPSKKKNLIITAPLPRYFQWTCDSLKLNTDSDSL